MSVIEKVQHYQRSIEKCFDNEERVMYCISKLYQLPVTVQHLRETGVGRTVNSLRKFDGGVGNAAKALVCKWKTMVADEDSSDPEEEDEACVPDAPESYSESPESPSPDNTSENNRSRHNNEESKEKSANKSIKHRSSETSSKYSLKGNMNSEISKSKSSDKERHSKTESKNHEQKHENTNRKHSSKHEYDNEKSTISKEQDSKRRHDSRDKNRTDSDIGKVSSSTESCEMNDNHRKRKQEKSTRDKEVIKKKRYSDSDSEEDNSRLIINSPIVSETESPNAESETTGTSKKKTNNSCDKTASRKETIDKEKKRNKEKSDTKHKSKAEGERESSKPKDSKKDDKRKKESLSSSKHSSKSKSSHSSSYSKERSRSSDVDQEKDKKHKRDDKSKSSDSKENHKDQKLKKKIKKENSDVIDGIDSQSGTSFAEALGMCTMPPPSRKRGNNTTSSSVTKPIKVEPGTSTSAKIALPITIKTEASNINLNPLSLLSPNVKLEPLSVDLAATLPEISPNYKPLAHNLVPVNRKIDECRALSDAIYCKTQRTKVFSGNKSSLTNIPTLYELCIRVLIDNIEALEVTGGVPYYIIKPVLERATPDQLFMLEHYNPYLIEDTDPLWKFHCSREFRTQSREEMESWRDMYMRCLDEREAKLKAFTANMKQSMDKSVPVRSTIQVYDDHIKPPRNILRKQAKYGTARDLPITSSEVKKKLISGNTQSNSSTTCPPSPIARIKASSSTIGKKTKAPLMAKAIKFIKGSYRR